METQAWEQTSSLKSFGTAPNSWVGYQIYFDDRSRAHLDDKLNPYFNDAPSIFLESQVIADLLEEGAHRHGEFFGVFSWKMRMKLGISATGIYRHMQSDGFQSDIYTFDFTSPGPSVWFTTDTMETTLLSRAGERLLKEVGYDVEMKRLQTRPIFQNHFVCRSSLYDAFYREMLKPCLEVMQNPKDPELRALLSRNSGYAIEDSIRARVQGIFGEPFFKLYPFIAERLFATWMALRAAKYRFRVFVIPSRGPRPLGEKFDNNIQCAP